MYYTYHPNYPPYLTTVILFVSLKQVGRPFPWKADYFDSLSGFCANAPEPALAGTMNCAPTKTPATSSEAV